MLLLQNELISFIVFYWTNVKYKTNGYFRLINSYIMITNNFCDIAYVQFFFITLAFHRSWLIKVSHIIIILNFELISVDIGLKLRYSYNRIRLKEKKCLVISQIYNIMYQVINNDFANAKFLRRLLSIFFVMLLYANVKL